MRLVNRLALVINVSHPSRHFSSDFGIRYKVVKLPTVATYFGRVKRIRVPDHRSYHKLLYACIEDDVVIEKTVCAADVISMLALKARNYCCVTSIARHRSIALVNDRSD